MANMLRWTCQGVARMGAPILFHSQTDQNREHDEADDSLFLSR